MCILSYHFVCHLCVFIYRWVIFIVPLPHVSVLIIHLERHRGRKMECILFNKNTIDISYCTREICRVTDRTSGNRPFPCSSVWSLNFIPDLRFKNLSIFVVPSINQSNINNNYSLIPSSIERKRSQTIVYTKNIDIILKEQK